jgi:hypothetical protein
MEGARLATALQLPDGKEAVYAGCDLEPMFLRAAGRCLYRLRLCWIGICPPLLWLVCSAIFGPDNVCCPEREPGVARF